MALFKWSITIRGELQACPALMAVPSQDTCALRAEHLRGAKQIYDLSIEIRGKWCTRKKINPNFRETLHIRKASKWLTQKVVSLWNDYRCFNTLGGLWRHIFFQIVIFFTKFLSLNYLEIWFNYPCWIENVIYPQRILSRFYFFK